ncbi:uncharacterized protein CIMG_08396 [Coccidioides immitis RS]|uniref:Uncharacterized protein n=1 Tax=Coccidioides immitis (strain RS) TaxID=246410 RepID=J3K5F1_COCIM|nr:uncharacterized protein CIMG_08396 [Coccidioides immitis RS]EAS29650.3 hypothetical protein CIMG_08396 [Coccidioides immitis RS]
MASHTQQEAWCDTTFITYDPNLTDPINCFHYGSTYCYVHSLPDSQIHCYSQFSAPESTRQHKLSTVQKVVCEWKLFDGEERPLRGSLRSIKFKYKNRDPVSHTLSRIDIITTKAAVNALQNLGVALADVDGSPVYHGSVISLKGELIGSQHLLSVLISSVSETRGSTSSTWNVPPSVHLHTEFNLKFASIVFAGATKDLGRSVEELDYKNLLSLVPDDFFKKHYANDVNDEKSEKGTEF